MSLIHPASLAEIAAYALPALGLFSRRGGRTNRRGIGNSGSAPAAPPATPLTIITSVPVSQWVRGDLGITIGTGVSAWADQSGNGRDFTQATGGAQPTYSASDATLNNRPTLTFDGVDDILSSAWARPASGTTPTWICAVIKQITWTANETIIADTTANYAIIRQRTASPQIEQIVAASANINGGLAVGSWGRCEAYFSASIASYLKLITTTTTGTNEGGGGTVGTGTRLGANSIGTTVANFAIAELIVTAGLPTVGERSGLDSYITSRYGAGLV